MLIIFLQKIVFILTSSEAEQSKKVENLLTFNFPNMSNILNI